MRVISVHIPKTAGLSFRDHLEAIFGQKRVIYDYNHADRPGHMPPPIPPYILKRLRKTHKTTVVHGHFWLSRYAGIPAAHRVMWFRDPVERLLSHYYYWLKGPDMEHPNCRALHENGLSVVEFAKLPELTNVFCRFLDGQPLAELDYIGLVEEYQISLDLFYNFFAIGSDPRQVESHKNRNFARGDSPVYPISKAVRSEIERINREDVKLYEGAKKQFEVTKERFGRGY